MKEKSQEKKIDIESLLNQTEDDSLLIELGQHLFNKYYKNGFDNLTKPEQIIFMIDQLEREINNGGFEQYYGNSGSDYAQDVPLALESIGASYTADLVRKGNSLFPNDLPPKIWPDRQVLLDNIVEDIRDQLDELDNLFYEYKDPLGFILDRINRLTQIGAVRYEKVIFNRACLWDLLSLFHSNGWFTCRIHIYPRSDEYLPG